MLHSALYTCEQQPESPATLLQWPQFPLDIRLQVFEMLAWHSNRHKNGTTPSKPCLARYAAVCKEWQVFFEKIIYRRLVLTQSCLKVFDKIVHRQKSLVKHIWLRIKLEDYSCPACFTFGTLPWRTTDSETVSEAIMQLFLILSTWLQRDVALHGELTLEFSIYSPSDSQHTFRGDLHFGPDPLETDDDRRQRLSTHDPYHGWHHGQRLSLHSMASISGALAALSPNFREGLPSVKAVTRFILRRQTRRALDTASLQKIFKSLPSLQSINFEPWRDFHRYPEYLRDRHYRNMILTSFPDTLKTLSLFEDFNEDYNSVYYFHHIMQNRPHPPELVRTPHPSVGAALAHRSIGLGRLFASYMVDANDFFCACKPNWTWHNLTTLALTSKLFSLRNPNHFAIKNMLVNAGTAALRMPQLQTMVIWNGMKRLACAFRYQATATSTTLGWCGTWELELNDDVDDVLLNVWREAALRHNPRHELSILTSRSLNKHDIKSHADAIHELSLSESEVIHPVSLEQIRRESEQYYFNVEHPR